MNTPSEHIAATVKAQKEFFATHATRDIAFRKQALRRLEAALRKYEKPLAAALWNDLHKSYEEAYLTEIGLVYAEIKKHLQHVHRWARPQRVAPTMSVFPSRSKVLYEPLGTALIIAPWNYPVQLLLSPLVGAISAGCTAVLKPSPYVPHVAQVLEQMVAEAFDEQYVAVVQGDRTVNAALLEQRYDLLFFTGSPALGKIVMTAAAKNLTPVVLELGGKSPCIVDADADLALAARRIAWGKALNAGQTCIAPDYLLLHESVKAPFIEALKRAFVDLLGDNPRESQHYAHIVNDKAFARLRSYLSDGEIVFGGTTDAAERYFAPTILDHVSPDSSVMCEEIFGPIFPIQTFGTLDEAVLFVNAREKPLALYYFGKNGERVLRHTSSGGACINDTIMHIANDNLPFGGVGQSGMSAYHGVESFRVFSHRRAVVSSPTWIDVPFRYMPYSLFRFVKRLL